MDLLQKATPTYDETTPVLIVGGSLVGLSMSLFLSWHGIPSLLVERHSGISPHPRAFNFNIRTMEFLRLVGAEKEVHKKAPPGFQNSGILQAESLAGREFHWITQDTTASDISPTSGCIIGQDALEPILRARAEALGSDLRFSTELVSFEQDADGVSAVIRQNTTGEKLRIRARYLIAADGNRSTVRQQHGIKTYGPGPLGHQLSILFSADVQEPLRGRKLAVCFVNNPQVRKGTSLVFERNGQGFALFTPYFPEKGESVEDFAGEHGIKLIQGAIGVPDLPVEILSIRPWEVAAWVAASFQQENVFLVGDAAHVTPPAGAFGANTGIADAYNLAWKLRLVLRGVADPNLLLTYTEERQPVARRTAEQAFLMFKSFNFASLDQKKETGILPYDSVAFGYRYHSAALPENGESESWCEDPHTPAGCPGTHAAHVLLQKQGEELSTRDLFGKSMVLFTGEQGESWREAARSIAARLQISLEVYQIGRQGDLVDVYDRFFDAYGIGSAGAVLVRPDGFISWRAETSDTSPELALEQGLTRLLQRRVEIVSAL
jgi:putative polyketide hydroxylase